jgi:hypothetical protein
MDPQMILHLQTGTRDDLKELKKGATPEGACYKILTSLAYRWAGFHGSFGGKKDPSRATWFPITECLPRFRTNAYALLRHTWKLAGQSEPREETNKH